MKNVFKARYQKIQKVIESINEIIKDEAEKEKEFISNLNRNQLSKGKRGDGSSLPSYVPNSKQPKAPGPIQLFDDGGFYQGITPLFEGTGFEMDSTDEKTIFLEAVYNPQILEISKENALKIGEKILPAIKQKINEQINAE